MFWRYWRGWLLELVTRPVCAVQGCRAEHPSAHCCDRCGADMYEGWIDWALGDPFRDLWRRFLAFFKRARCAECGKKLNRRQRDPYETLFCSEDCEERWLPF